MRRTRDPARRWGDVRLASERRRWDEKGRLKCLSSGAHVTEPGAYEVAREGGRHAGLLQVYQAKSTAELRRALRSYERQVERHQQKMKYPEQFVQDWYTKSLRVQHGLRRHWQEDITRNQELADVMRGIMRERGE